MEAANSSQLASPDATESIEQLNRLFGAYRAEYLGKDLFELYTEPAYFGSLTARRNCMLVGGRGSGKTTVLRGLSYEGRFALANHDVAAVVDSPYVGIYYRVNTNRVSAFRGRELEESAWVRHFSHYFNLLLCEQTLRFTSWYERLTGRALNVDSVECSTVAATLHGEADSLQALHRTIVNARTAFEAYINNVADATPPPLSMAGAPVDALMSTLANVPEFDGRHFFFLIDEYENFEAYQQVVVNTLIKQAGELYTFKVGIRELGWKRRTTLNPDEQLVHPADYARISIAEELGGSRFDEFAAAVCNRRISRLKIRQNDVIRDVMTLLPGLSEDEEARRLGAEEEASRIIEALRPHVTAPELRALSETDPLRVILIDFWAQARDRPLVEMYLDFRAHPEKWETRFTNYGHALLYPLRRGKRGIRKYYCGWSVFTHLAAGNIRYLLELVDQSLLRHVQADGSLAQPVSPDVQTAAAQSVGQKNLTELEGLAVEGARLTRLLLGLGRVFGTMAAQPLGHTPELNQFHLEDSSAGSALDKDATEVERLLRAAVMHLALVRSTGTKLAEEGATREYDYMVHPIFSPFFVFSYRRKRKMSFTDSEIIGLVHTPRETIPEILGRTNRRIEDDLPDQLRLFEAYYASHADTSTSD